MSSTRPAIPEGIKRQVRQKCFFGCAICGMPFYEYEHIEEYAQVQEHTIDNIILLCPNHHAAKTTKKLSKERLLHAQKNPYNSQKDFSSVFQIEPSANIEVKLGSNVFTWTLSDIPFHYICWVNGESYFTLHNDSGWLSFTIKLTNDKGDEKLIIDNGEMKVSTSIFDFSYVGQNVIIKDAIDEKTILDMRLSNNKVEIDTGIFMDKSGDGFIVRNNSLETIINYQNNRSIIGGTFLNNYGGSVGILNNQKHPDIIRPRGFGFFIGGKK